MYNKHRVNQAVVETWIILHYTGITKTAGMVSVINPEHYVCFDKNIPILITAGYKHANPFTNNIKVLLTIYDKT